MGRAVAEHRPVRESGGLAPGGGAGLRGRATVRGGARLPGRSTVRRGYRPGDRAGDTRHGGQARQCGGPANVTKACLNGIDVPIGRAPRRVDKTDSLRIWLFRAPTPVTPLVANRITI